MTILDAYCLVALTLDEPAAAEVQDLLHSGSAAMASLNLAEALDVLQRRERRSESEVRSALAPVLRDAVKVVPLETEHAWRAAAIRSRYYAPRDCELSLADCVLVSAAGEGDVIATADPAVVATARAEGIDVLALPDSRGVRPG